MTYADIFEVHPNADQALPRRTSADRQASEILQGRLCHTLGAIALLLLIHIQIEDYKTALHDMHTGETIKPVILF